MPPADIAKPQVYETTAYGPPWGGQQGSGVTASGIDLRNTTRQYLLVAADPNVLPQGTKIRFAPNPFGNPALVFTVSDTGGAIKGHKIDFYIESGRTAQNGWGRRNVQGVVVGSGSPTDVATLNGAGSTTTPPGGTAGLGGTGTLVNDITNSMFTVGDQASPHEDFWSAMNRLAMARYWYCFSDSETVYLADGPDLMKQPPVAWAHRTRNMARINHMSFVWDNTAFTYASTHRRRKRVQRRSHLARVTSPVEAELNWICDIDEIRAGDVVVLGGSGPGDGTWLVGTARRSIFQIWDELQLVPALSPLTEADLQTGTTIAGVNTSNNSKTTAFVPPKGGATNPAPGARWGRLDMGFDGNYGPAGAVAPFSGTIRGIGIGGWPGQGQYFVVVNDDQSGPDYTRAMYFAEGATPLVNNGDKVQAGQKIGQPVALGGDWKTPGNFEIGPANTSNYDTLAKSYGLGTPGARKMVLAFAAWLQSLGASASNNPSAAGNR